MSAYDLGRRKFLKRSVAAGVVTGAAASFRSASAGADEPKRGGDLIVGLDGASVSDKLDLATYSGTFMHVLGMQCFNTLCAVDDSGALVPALAESWSTEPDAKRWVLKLRRGVQFHDGKELTATDVLYSLNLHRGQTTKSAARPLLKPISDISASDKYEVTIVLDQGNADLPYILSDYHLGITAEGNATAKAVGTGPFVLQSFEPGVKALSKRNPNYWDGGRAWVDTVQLVGINDAVSRVSALLSGSVHLINRVSPAIADKVAGNQAISMYNYKSSAFYSFPMRADTPPFDNNDFRLAVKHAIDREAIVRTILRGYGQVGNDQPIPSFNPLFASDIPQRTHDPDKANFYLKKSGFTGSISLSAADVAFPGAVNAAQLIQASCKVAGLQVDVVREPADGYWDNVWMKKPFCISNSGGRPTADIMFSTYFTSDAPWNESFWKRPEFDKLVVAARSELDLQKRKDMYRQLQLMLVDDGGEIIPCFNNFIDASTARLAGFEPTPTYEMSGLRAPEKVWFK